MKDLGFTQCNHAMSGRLPEHGTYAGIGVLSLATDSWFHQRIDSLLPPSYNATRSCLSYLTVTYAITHQRPNGSKTGSNTSWTSSCVYRST